MHGPELTLVANIRDPKVMALADEATKFLSNQSWCRSVESVSLGWAITGILGVFLLRVIPDRPGIDDTLWVVVGDLPPAYVVYDGNPTWHDALEAYVLEMERWVATVRRGSSLGDVIPVRAEPTQEHAEMLARRLSLIRREILAHDDLSPGDA